MRLVRIGCAVPFVVAVAAACALAFLPKFEQARLAWYISLRFDAGVWKDREGHIVVMFKPGATDRTIDIAIEYLRRLDGLKTVDCVSSDISDESVRQLSSLLQLEVIDLSGTKVSDKGLTYLTTLSKLRRLRLARTAITDEGVESLVKIERLRILELSETGVTDIALDRLRSAKRLQLLLLFETKMTTEAIKEFERSRPDVAVNYSEQRGP